MAIGGLLLVFAMWWSYFKHEPDVGRHRSLRSMLGWGYGHYFVFAAIAALGAGLSLAAESARHAAHVPDVVAALAVAVPVVVYLVALLLVDGPLIAARPCRCSRWSSRARVCSAPSASLTFRAPRSRSC